MEDIKSRWEYLSGQNVSSLERARDVAKLTIPHLLPPEGHTEDDTLPTPFQSLGAKGLNNLASKMMLLFAPPSIPFVSLDVPTELRRKLKGTPDELRKVRDMLTDVEKSLTKHIEKKKIRSKWFEAFRLLPSCGDALMVINDEEGILLFKMDKYVIQRDRSGTLLELILKETKDIKTLTPDVAESVIKGLDAIGLKQFQKHQCVDMYTHILLNNRKKYDITQYADKFPINEQTNIAPKMLGWFPLRWSEITGEHNGRGLGEEVLGDLRSYEGYSITFAQVADLASRLIPLVNPNGLTRISDLANAKNGEPIEGREEDIGMFQANKAQDLQVLFQQSEIVRKRLEQFFMLYESFIRNNERVTAEEIQTMRSQVDEAVGGSFTYLSDQFKDIIKFLVRDIVKKDSDIKNVLMEHGVTAENMDIMVGAEAILRNHELNKIVQFLQLMTQLDPEYVNKIQIDIVANKIAHSMQIDISGFHKTAEQLDMEKQQQYEADMLQNVAPNMVSGAMQQQQQ